MDGVDLPLGLDDEKFMYSIQDESSRYVHNNRPMISPDFL